MASFSSSTHISSSFISVTADDEDDDLFLQIESLIFQQYATERESGSHASISLEKKNLLMNEQQRARSLVNSTNDEVRHVRDFV